MIAYTLIAHTLLSLSSVSSICENKPVARLSASDTPHAYRIYRLNGKNEDNFDKCTTENKNSTASGFTANFFFSVYKFLDCVQIINFQRKYFKND